MIEKLIAEIEEKDTPMVVGLDPMPDALPRHLVENAIRAHGETLEAAAEAVWEFNRQLIDALCDIVAAVKPQIAMYEQFGVPGMAVYEKTIAYCHEKDLYVIGDIKRGDIGSTSAAYAAAHLGQVQIGETRIYPFNEDFVTVNPYLGSDGVRPFLTVCREEDRGIFVLVKTSNPSSGEFQDRLLRADAEAGIEEGTPLYEVVARQVAAWAEEHRHGMYSDVGAVVGATYPEIGRALRKIMPHSYILVPGYGAQGGRAEDLAVFFNRDGLGAIINSSRGILYAYREEQYARFGEEAFADAARQAAFDMRDDIRRVL